jgi:PAS domain S-box-containing protein
VKNNANIGRRVRHRLDALLASAGLAVCVLLGVGSTASVGWVWWQRQTHEVADAQARAQSASALIRTAAAASLTTSPLADARRQITETATSAGLNSWEIILPDGSIIASSDPAAPVVHELPATWPAASVDRGAGLVHTGEFTLPGRGTVVLRFDLVPTQLAWNDPAVLGVAGISAFVMLAWWGAWHRAARKVAPVVHVHDALACAAEGETSPDALRLDEAFGPEAVAWNSILSDREATRLRDLEEKAGKLLNASGSESTSELSGLCDAMWIGMLILDAEGRIAYCNGAAATLLHAKREELPGRPAKDFVTDVELSTLVERAVSGGLRHRVMQEKQIAVPGASSSILRFSIKSLRKEDNGAAFIVIEDITQQKVAEESRHSFAAQVAHELRTPLTNIRLYVDTLLEDESNDPAVRARCLNVASSEIRRLERVVSDMLSVSEMEAGSITLRRDDVRMDALLEELEADHRATAQDKEIQLHFDLPPKFPVIDGDRDKIAMALHNLLGNAIKYTPTGGDVRVIVSEEGGQLVILVKDNGIGIKPEETELVFEKFYRAKDKRINGITGSGLGLAIAREVIRLHGGDIGVTSQIDKGSTFSLSLPLSSQSGSHVRAAA